MLSDVFFVPMRAAIGIPPEAAAVLLIGGIPMVIIHKLIERGTVTHPAAKQALTLFAFVLLAVTVVVGWGDFSFGRQS